MGNKGTIKGLKSQDKKQKAAELRAKRRVHVLAFLAAQEQQDKVLLETVPAELSDKLKRCFIETVPDYDVLIEAGLVRLKEGGRWSLTHSGITIMLSRHGDFWRDWNEKWEQQRRAALVGGSL